MTITESTLTADEQRVNDLVDQLLSEFPPKSTTPVDFLGARGSGFARTRARLTDNTLATGPA